MDQTALAAEILERLAQPCTPLFPGEYITLPHAESIIDLTLNQVERAGSALELQYLSGHRRRLAKTLTTIPFATGPDASCLDIGCFGHVSAWAKRHLGYAHVEGIEMLPDVEAPQIRRRIELDEHLDLTVFNFNIGNPEWPLQKKYDTVLFFETLEHIPTDPIGVMANIGRLMTPTSTLVMSVPNAISYKTLHEFLCGTPPWVYWFFHPDLKHEPRHSFEYTPFILHFLLRSAGFEEAGTQSMTAFGDPADIKDLFDLARDLSIDERWFGETLLTQARKISEAPPIRYPACIYDPAAYYELLNPIISPVRWKALDAYKRGREEPRIALIESKQEIKRLSALNAQASEKYESTCTELATAIQHYRSSFVTSETNLKAQLVAAESEIARLNSQFSASTDETASLKTQLSDAFLSLDNALNRQVAAESMEAELKSRLAAADGEVASLKTQLSDAFLGLDNALNRQVAAESMEAELKSQLAAGKSETAQLGELLTDYKRRISLLETQISETLRSLDEALDIQASTDTPEVSLEKLASSLSATTEALRQYKQFNHEIATSRSHRVAALYIRSAVGRHPLSRGVNASWAFFRAFLRAARRRLSLRR